jgi:hypothetical protein
MEFHAHIVPAIPWRKQDETDDSLVILFSIKWPMRRAPGKPVNRALILVNDQAGIGARCDAADIRCMATNCINN